MERLLATLDGKTFVARLGGDEFPPDQSRRPAYPAARLAKPRRHAAPSVHRAYRDLLGRAAWAVNEDVRHLLLAGQMQN